MLSIGEAGPQLRSGLLGHIDQTLIAVSLFETIQMHNSDATSTYTDLVMTQALELPTTLKLTAGIGSPADSNNANRNMTSNSSPI